uniref:Uncharacterized protein n=1 Tax=Lepeophtheirus salmonis TaxID=72036 RepID=A0A0K2T174_LEPSM
MWESEYAGKWRRDKFGFIFLLDSSEGKRGGRFSVSRSACKMGLSAVALDFLSSSKIVVPPKYALYCIQGLSPNQSLLLTSPGLGRFHDEMEIKGILLPSRTSPTKTHFRYSRPFPAIVITPLWKGPPWFPEI